MKLGGRELQGFGWMQTPAAADRVVFARARRPRLFARAPRVCGRGAFTRNVVAALGKTKTASMTPRESVTALKLAAPATIAPLTFVVSDEEKARVEEVLREAKSASTRRAYSSDWKRFDVWCRRRGSPALPAPPEVVVVYLRELLDKKKSTATIERALVALSMAHAAADLARPRESLLVQEFMRGLRRMTRERRRRRAPAITLEDLKAMVDATPATSSARIRDRAMLLLGFFGAFRRSELVALDKSDLEERPEGFEVELRWSKTDQVGRGAVLGIPLQKDERYCPVRAVREWLGLRGSDEEPALFLALDQRCHGKRLKPQAVERVLAGAVERAKLTRRFTPHSLRAGFATAAARAGAAERTIMKQTRHKSVATLYGYIREADVFIGNSAVLT